MASLPGIASLIQQSHMVQYLKQQALGVKRLFLFPLFAGGQFRAFGARRGEGTKHEHQLRYYETPCPSRALMRQVLLAKLLRMGIVDDSF